MSALSRLSWRARATSSVIFAIALAGCDSVPHAWSRDDIEEIARDAAEDMVDDGGADADHEERIAELEAENRELRDTVDGHWRMIQELYDNQKRFTERYNVHTH